MPLFSSVIHAVSQDLEHLHKVLGPTVETDTFTQQLLGLLRRTARARAHNGSPITLGLHRSDYMLDEGSGNLLQVLLYLFIFVLWVSMQ